MCLDISLFARRKKAKSDITVAKVIVVPLTDDSLYGSQPYTPYQRFPIEFGKLYTSELVRDGWDIDQGLHSYADFVDAYYVSRHLAYGRYNGGFFNDKLDLKVYKAIIPKGSFYYFGKHGDNGASYASNQLIITDEILHSMTSYGNSDVPLY
ncbi:predicted ORF [Xanthomonas phage XacN1]|nr:predicted ORF [Xanthomonas phage XacN1]